MGDDAVSGDDGRVVGSAGRIIGQHIGEIHSVPANLIRRRL
jgi:hypothetical protein